MLIELLRGEGTPFDVGYRAGQELTREHGSTVDAVEIIEAVARRLGFEPHREAGRPGTDRLDIVLGRCPFAASALMAPDIVCELHRGLADGIADTAPGDVTVVGLVVRPPRRAGCRIQLQRTAG
jgi:predicted ArsR family transcriptional regulator